jgi:hypothetical protein
MKTPPAHIVIKIREIRIINHTFEIGSPFEMISDDFSQRGFAHTNVSGNSDKIM